MADKLKLETISLAILLTICLISNIKCNNETNSTLAPTTTTKAPIPTTALPSTCEMGKASKHEQALLDYLKPIFNQKYRVN